jgi:hypothetical protein
MIRWHYDLLLLADLLALWLASPGSLAFDKVTTIIRWH